MQQPGWRQASQRLCCSCPTGRGPSSLEMQGTNSPASSVLALPGQAGSAGKADRECQHHAAEKGFYDSMKGFLVQGGYMKRRVGGTCRAGIEWEVLVDSRHAWYRDDGPNRPSVQHTPWIHLL